MIIFLLLLTAFVGISAVSAAENTSISDDVLEIENLNETQVLEKNTSNLNLSANESGQNNVIIANKVKKQIPSKAKTKDIKSTYGKNVKYKLKLLDKEGKIISGKKVKFKIGKKTYKIKTNSKGIAALKLNYPAGKYTISYNVGDVSGRNTYTVKNKISLTVLKWGNKGDISKNKLIRNNMPKNIWVKKAVHATKKGIPLIKIRGGNGKKVFITAGVHGNEISSQIAVIKLIVRLTKIPVKGSVYIIPFVNIKAISHNVRYTDNDYNRIAHKSGTIPNNIVKLVKRYNCDAYGDFHCTQPGGKPGKNVAMGTYSPTVKSATIAKYIAKKSKVTYLIYEKAGEEYPGALEDVVSLNHIPAVTCEVIVPHGKITKKSVAKSLSMMKTLLKFNKII